MADKKRYYWLKLQNDFFSSKRMKKLRKVGADYVIIYLKMQLLSLKNNGVLQFTGLENSFAEELALDLDEDTDKVQLTLSFLQSCGLIEAEEDLFFLPYVAENTGSETATAQRVRDYRDRQKVLHCNTDVTEVKHLCNVEKEIEKELDKDICIEKSKRFVPPTLDQVKDYCTERKNNVDPEKFINFYESKGWYVGKNKMKDWKASVRTWEKDSKPTKKDANNGLHSQDYDIAAIEKALLGE